MTKLTVLLLAVSLGLATADPSDKPSQPAAPAKVRNPGDAPAIPLADAVAQATAYARKQKIDLSKDYLQSASFDSVQRRWAVVWQRPNAKGGHAEIRVSESGTFDVGYGE
jgi:hypothetical protein